MDKLGCTALAVKKIFDIFPSRFTSALKKTVLDSLCEIRVRVGQPILLVYNGKKVFLSNDGVAFDPKKSLLPTKEEVEQIIFLACDKSVYAYVDQLLGGFLPLEGGGRLGVCGHVSLENRCPTAMNGFSSVNIRIPHEVKNCSLPIKKHFLSPTRNTLVISKPACGKTTFLRDMVYQLRGKAVNTLIVDEREELAGVKDGKSLFELNGNCDVLTNCPKKYAIEWGIRSLAPDVIVCDELFIGDMATVATAIESGIKFFASVHADSIENAVKKLDLNDKKLFERYVLLNNENGVGTIEGTYDEKFFRLT